MNNCIDIIPPGRPRFCDEGTIVSILARLVYHFCVTNGQLYRLVRLVGHIFVMNEQLYQYSPVWYTTFL